MANEAQLRVRTDNPLDFTIADGAGIEKGAILELLDPLTASGAATANVALAGIAAREKVISDGRTRLAVFRRGVFDMLASGAIAVGKAVSSAGHDNYILQAPITASGAAILGHALETAADGETIQVYVDVGAGGNHLS